MFSISFACAAKTLPAYTHTEKGVAGGEGEGDRHCSQSVEELAHIIQNILQHAFNKLLFRFHLFSLMFLFFLANKNKSSSWMAAGLVKYATATYICVYLCVAAYTHVCVCLCICVFGCLLVCAPEVVINL